MKINFVKLIKINIYLTCFKLLEILESNGSRTSAAFNMELLMKITNGSQSYSIVTKRSMLDVAQIQDQPLSVVIAFIVNILLVNETAM